MMKISSFVIFGICISISAFAGLELVKPPELLEPLPDTTQIHSVLKLRNKSPESLSLREIRSCCGCLTASAPTTEIAAGAEFELAFTYDAKGRKGLQKGGLTLVPVKGEVLMVPIEIFLRRSFDAEPRLLRWKKGASDKFLEAQIEVDPSLSPATPRIHTPSADFPAELLPGKRPGVWILRVQQAARPKRDNLTLELPLPGGIAQKIEIFLTQE